MIIIIIIIIRRVKISILKLIEMSIQIIKI